MKYTGLSKLEMLGEIALTGNRKALEIRVILAEVDLFDML
jgi:hypothetical protein